MVFTKHKLFAPAVLTTCLLVVSASPAFAQDKTSTSGSRTVGAERPAHAVDDADDTGEGHGRPCAAGASVGNHAAATSRGPAHLTGERE